MDIKKIRKYIQIPVILLLMLVGIYVSWLYKNGVLTEGQAKFWFAVIVTPMCIVELIGSHLTGESFAKGAVIRREDTPDLFLISNCVTYFLLFFCILGIFYYW